MKSRKIVIAAFILLAALALGIGYAQLSTTLVLQGNATVDLEAAEENFNNKIYFAEPTVVESQCTGTGGSDTKKDAFTLTTSDHASFVVQTLAVKDEKSVFTVKIKNDSNVAAKVEVNSTKLSGAANNTNSNPDYFDVEYAYDKADMIIPKGGEMLVTITVTIKQPVTSAMSGTFDLEYTVTTVENTNP